MESYVTKASDMIHTLAAIMELHDQEAHEHIIHIQHYTRVLLNYMAETYSDYDLTSEQIGKIVEACVLQDLGKIVIPDYILYKPGKLLDHEFEIYKQHTVRGCEILESIPDTDDEELMEYCRQICRNHHERYDGSGFPDGLQGEEIPIAAQVVSIVEVFDLMTTDHFYRKRCRSSDAYHTIISGRAGAFSPRLIHCLQLARDEMIEYSLSENKRKEEAECI